MPPTSTVTAASRARKFPEDFFVDNGKLMCHFCDHSINFQTKNTITTHIGSKTHLRNMMYFNNQNSGLCFKLSITRDGCDTASAVMTLEVVGAWK
ncbi:hypothetical protein C1646_766506 [Rhizophagus diaphanus]|nr:hypothetical protein C1646_766506 [Rhizophagus diaphanus] [Rhizophagus sp. MUCL 43196]